MTSYRHSKALPPILPGNDHLLDMLLFSSILRETDPGQSIIAKNGFQALSSMVKEIELDPLIQYLKNSWFREDHALWLTEVSMNRLHRNDLPRDDICYFPFTIIRALYKTYPIISRVESNGMNLVTSVAHAWKHDLCLRGSTNVAYECSRVISYVLIPAIRSCALNSISAFQDYRIGQSLPA